MRIKENLVLKEIAGAYVVLPVGAATIDFTGILSLNESGTMLWRLLEKGATREELVKAITSEYDVEEDVAFSDVDEFIAKITEADCLDI